MIRICYSPHHVGNRVFGEKEPLEDRRATHGLCSACLYKELKIIKQTLEELRHATNDANDSELHE